VRYPLSRVLHFYTRQATVASEKQKTVDEFLAYALSPEGQKIVASQGFLPITHPPIAQPVTTIAANVNNTVPASNGYGQFTSGFRRLDLTFHFYSGHGDLQPDSGGSCIASPQASSSRR
jgi:hypothetical protein